MDEEIKQIIKKYKIPTALISYGRYSITIQISNDAVFFMSLDPRFASDIRSSCYPLLIEHGIKENDIRMLVDEIHKVILFEKLEFNPDCIWYLYTKESDLIQRLTDEDADLIDSLWKD